MSWKDTSLFSRGETDRTPNEWTLQVTGGRLVVFRSLHYPDEWCCSFYFHGGAVLDQKRLAPDDIEQAKARAIELARAALNAALVTLI